MEIAKIRDVSTTLIQTFQVNLFLGMPKNILLFSLASAGVFLHLRILPEFGLKCSKGQIAPSNKISPKYFHTSPTQSQVGLSE